MPTALITGASAGLGAEFARLFAADKHDVVLVARRRERLDELAAELQKAHGIKAQVIAADLMAPDAGAKLVAEVDKLGVEIEFLVNNAGFGSSGAFVEADAQKELGMLQLNIMTLTALCQAFVPRMVRRGRGRVLNIGSTAGCQPGPYMALYYASKAFVNSFTEALAYELKGTGVTATLSCPGATMTEFAAVAGNDKSRLFEMGAMPGPVVAKLAYKAMHAGTRMAVHGLLNKFTVFSIRVTPRPVVNYMAALLNKSSSGTKALGS
jgi:short-subunit dehydrogenase